MSAYMATTTLTLLEAVRAGYCITSRASQLATRIDREDWKEHMATKQPNGERWVRGMDPQGAADHYRRCYSNDSIRVPASWLGKMPNSGDGPAAFRPLPAARGAA